MYFSMQYTFMPSAALKKSPTTAGNAQRFTRITTSIEIRTNEAQTHTRSLWQNGFTNLHLMLTVTSYGHAFSQCETVRARTRTSFDVDF